MTKAFKFYPGMCFNAKAKHLKIKIISRYPKKRKTWICSMRGFLADEEAFRIDLSEELIETFYEFDTIASLRNRVEIERDKNEKKKKKN